MIGVLVEHLIPGRSVCKHGKIKVGNDGFCKLECALTNRLDVYIGSRILERRVEVGLSPERLAEMIGCSSHEMAEFEAGHRRASAQLLADLAKALGVDIGFFFEGIASVDFQRSPLSQTISATVIPFPKRPMGSFDHD